MERMAQSEMYVMRLSDLLTLPGVLRWIELDVFGWACCSHCVSVPPWQEELSFTIRTNKESGKREVFYDPELNSVRVLFL